jgi:hypothetical protein
MNLLHMVSVKPCPKVTLTSQTEAKTYVGHICNLMERAGRGKSSTATDDEYSNHESFDSNPIKLLWAKK